MKIRPVAAELFHADEWAALQADGRTDMTKLIVTFCSFSNASEKSHFKGTTIHSNEIRQVLCNIYWDSLQMYGQCMALRLIGLFIHHYS